MCVPFNKNCDVNVIGASKGRHSGSYTATALRLYSIQQKKMEYDWFRMFYK